MESTQNRLDSIEGLLLGVAIGDSLGFAREGLSRRTALRMFGRSPLKYTLWPRAGLYSDDTQLMLLAAQSVVCSRSDSETFLTVFRRRLAWYAVSLPVGVGQATWLAGLKYWVSWLGVPGACWSAGNGPATRSMLISLALYRTGHRTWKWVHDSARVTHSHPHTSDACGVLALLAEIAATNRPGKLDTQAALQRIMQTSQIVMLRERLEELAPMLEAKRSPSYVARHFGWQHGISGYIIPSVIMAAYCFLRYPTDYRRCVEAAILLGGDTDSVGAIAGGLVGSHIGKSNLPKDLVKQLSDWPHDREWMHDMALRLTHWPHGVDDILTAPSLRSHPFSQLLRNIIRWPLVLLHLILRIPYAFRSLLG